MSAIDFCETCGGHGAVTGEEIPREELSPRRQQGHDHGRRYHRSVDCPDCDGRDYVTPHMESLAEDGAA